MIVIITGLIASTLRAATPLLLAALGGTFSERSGVVNIALEGIMLTGAWFAVYGSFLTGSALVGLAMAVVAGGLISLLHAVASVHFKANQVVSGTAINLLAAGFTEYMMVQVWGGQSPQVARMPDLGPLNIFVYIAFGLAAVSWWVLYKTPWGLRLRAVGEHPKAADTVGVNVYAMRYWGVLLSGLLAGLGGASLSIGLVARYTGGMTAGRGFIGLAAMIFGKWNPVGAVLACLLFGLADSLGTLLQIWGIPIPNEFVFMAPYVVTMLALAGVVGRSTPPAASGVPYEKAH
ncbi:MAG TPA: ABC transporter permease [Symbiobacteriaceae bacterium]|jgi:simple sugar transport system permease protein|nr:ABC transporter permease [Symbiobacteriaceae bacterium]